MVRNKKKHIQKTNMLVRKQRKDNQAFLVQFNRRQHRYPWEVTRNPASEKLLKPFGTGAGALLNPRADIYIGEEGPDSNLPGAIYFIRKDMVKNQSSVLPTTIPGYPQVTIPMSDGSYRKVGVHQAAGPTLFDRPFVAGEVVDHMKSPLSNTKDTLRIVSRAMNSADANITGVSVSLQDGQPKWRANVTKGAQRKVGLWYNDPAYAQKESAALFKELYGQDLVHPRRKMTKAEQQWRIDKLKAKVALAPPAPIAAGHGGPVVELGDEVIAPELDLNPPDLPPLVVPAAPEVAPVQDFGGIEVPSWLIAKWRRR